MPKIINGYNDVKLIIGGNGGMYEELKNQAKALGIEEVDINFLINNFSNNGTRVVKHPAKPLDRDVANIIYKSCI